MARSIKKPSKNICRLCKKFGIRLTRKQGGKRVYKSKTVLLFQLKRKMKMSKGSRFGKRSSFGKKHHSMFGKSSSKLRKLHKLCKLYGVKIGKKSPKVLSQACLKKAKGVLKKHSRFGSIFSWVGLTTNSNDKVKEKKQDQAIELRQIESAEIM